MIVLCVSSTHAVVGIVQLPRRPKRIAIGHRLEPRRWVLASRSIPSVQCFSIRMRVVVVGASSSVSSILEIILAGFPGRIRHSGERRIRLIGGRRQGAAGSIPQSHGRGKEGITGGIIGCVRRRWKGGGLRTRSATAFRGSWIHRRRRRRGSCCCTTARSPLVAFREDFGYLGSYHSLVRGLGLDLVATMILMQLPSLMMMKDSVKDSIRLKFGFGCMLHNNDVCLIVE